MMEFLNVTLFPNPKTKFKKFYSTNKTLFFLKPARKQFIDNYFFAFFLILSSNLESA